MIAIISLAIIAVISLIVVKVGTVSLVMTGLSHDIARFQAQSAFSGVGFTTQESELVVKHPVRRRIIRTLILLGNIGLSSAVASLIISFVGVEGTSQGLERLALILVILLTLFLVSRSKLIDRYLEKVIKQALVKWTSLSLYDYEHLLAIESGYSISNLLVEEGDWLEGKTLKDLRLNEEGILVLGIRRGSRYVGAPLADIKIQPGDVLTCYGKERSLKKLLKRKGGLDGDREHLEAIEEFRKESRKEKLKDAES